MAGLNYVGITPTDPDNVVNRRQATTVIDSAPVNRTDVSSQIHTAATATYASKTYIDTQDATFVEPDYYQDRDALNLPLTAVGQPNGAASLVDGKVPLAQMPALGSGFLLGPYGPTTTPVGRTAGESPLKLCDIAIGVKNYLFQPLVFGTVLATAAQGGRTVIEARMSDGAAVYGSQTLIARGVGRTLFTDTQAIAIWPTAPTTGATPTSWPDTTDIVVSLWVYDLAQSSTVSANGVVFASLWLLRTG